MPDAICTMSNDLVVCACCEHWITQWKTGTRIHTLHLAQQRPGVFRLYSDSRPYGCEDDEDGPDVCQVPLVKMDSIMQTVCMQWYTNLLTHRYWQKGNPETNDHWLDNNMQV